MSLRVFLRGFYFRVPNVSDFIEEGPMGLKNLIFIEFLIFTLIALLGPGKVFYKLNLWKHVVAIAA